MAVEYPMWLEEKDYVNQTAAGDDTPDTLIIGDSRAKSSVIPGELTDDGAAYNIAIGGASPVEMYYAAKNYLSSHPAPRNVIVIFAPYHFCKLDNWNQTLYYNYLSFSELLDAEANAVRLGDRGVIYEGWLPDLISFKLRLPNKYLDAIYTSRIGGNLKENTEKYDAVRRDLGYTAFGEEEENNEENYEVHFREFDISPMSEYYYLKLLDLLKDTGAKMIIEQAPYNEKSDSLITDEFSNGYRAFLEKAEERYPESIIEKEIPVYDKKCFGDNNHLNKRGAEKYTAEIREKYKNFLT
ncbi:MAG: hypothetical protein IJT63_00465 [Lachnospiraceae bacterium]|nr:hypothetical protein [Lachnospiraceae bacterium]